jgi:hypothetical protein
LHFHSAHLPPTRPQSIDLPSCSRCRLVSTSQQTELPSTSLPQLRGAYALAESLHPYRLRCTWSLRVCVGPDGVRVLMTLQPQLMCWTLFACRHARLFSNAIAHVEASIPILALNRQFHCLSRTPLLMQHAGIARHARTPCASACSLFAKTTTTTRPTHVRRALH